MDSPIWRDVRADFVNRNVAIVLDRRAGMKYREIGEKYGITRQRAWDVFHTYDKEVAVEGE